MQWFCIIKLKIILFFLNIFSQFVRNYLTNNVSNTNQKISEIFIKINSVKCKFIANICTKTLNKVIPN